MKKAIPWLILSAVGLFALTRRAKAQASPTPAANASTEMSATEAARLLERWTREGGNQGTGDNPSSVVATYQRAMGLVDDGIVGPTTRARAKALGFVLAPRSAQK